MITLTFRFLFLCNVSIIEYFQAHDNSSDQVDLQSQLEESKRQEEVLQKELYENMLRISALEAQLDRYRHGLDADAIVALEKAEAEERRMKEMALQEIETKEHEVSLSSYIQSY